MMNTAQALAQAYQGRGEDMRAIPIGCVCIQSFGIRNVEPEASMDTMNLGVLPRYRQKASSSTTESQSAGAG